MRAATLQRLLDKRYESSDVWAARAAAMQVDPIKAILDNQDTAGWWVKPGPGYAPKYTGSVWSLMFLDQLGADPAHPKVARAVDYLLGMTATMNGGFACSSAKQERVPPPSMVIHCLNGNLLHAFIGFGRLDDDRMRRPWSGPLARSRAKGRSGGTRRPRHRDSRAARMTGSRARGEH